MRVCFVLTSPFVVNAMLVPLSALASHHKLTLVVNLAEYQLSPELDPRIRVVNLDIRRKISLYKDVAALVWLFRFFSKERFDVVHSITPKSGLLSMLAAYLSRIDHRFHTFTGQVWVTRTGLRRYLLKKIDCLIAFLATELLTDGHSQRRFLENEQVVYPGKISVLGKGSISGVDQCRFRPDPEVRQRVRHGFDVADNSVVFLFVGRINQDKGILELADAFAKVAEKLDSVYLWLVGPDEEALRPEVIRRILPFEGRMVWVGATMNPEHYMAAADVLLLPSHREGLPMTIIEAAASGIPAIGTKIYGITDVIVDGETGLLVPVGDPGALADAMIQLAQNSEQRNGLGMCANQWISTNFSAGQMKRAWIEFYSAKR